MHDLLDGAAAESMELDAYYADFEKNFWSISELGFWKLERQQFFQEPGYDNWEASQETSRRAAAAPSIDRRWMRPGPGDARRPGPGHAACQSPGGLIDQSGVGRSKHRSGTS